MSDTVMGERWNTKDSVEMAIGLRRALASVIAGKGVPSECQSFLERGIEFLNEANGGGALISGNLEEADSFNGTYMPLCLANDVYISFVGGRLDEHQRYSEIRGLFTNYINALEKVKIKGQGSGIEPSMLRDIGQFFKVLCDLLLQQADPMAREYSRPRAYG